MSNTVILTLLSGKGGSGKTVIALAMSRILSEAGLSVLLVDCDLATHGATYFFEPELDRVPGVASLMNSRDAEVRAPLKTGFGFYFVPSTLAIMQDAAQQPTANEALTMLQSLLALSPHFDVVIFDCQAGFSPVAVAATQLATRNLFVLEPDAVSAAALRTLYLQLAGVLRVNYTWQLFNKLTEEERPAYEKVTSATLFPSLPPVPFDWQVRAAFAVRQVPSVLERSSAFGLGVLRLMKTVLPEFREKLDEVEHQTVGEWFDDIQHRLLTLEARRSDLKFTAIERVRRQRLRRLRTMTAGLTLIGLVAIVSALPPISNLVREQSTEFLSALVGLIAAVAGVMTYLSGVREMRAEFEQDRAQEAIDAVEREAQKYRTLLATDPSLQEFDRLGGRQMGSLSANGG